MESWKDEFADEIIEDDDDDLDLNDISTTTTATTCQDVIRDNSNMIDQQESVLMRDEKEEEEEKLISEDKNKTPRGPIDEINVINDNKNKKASSPQPTLPLNECCIMATPSPSPSKQPSSPSPPWQIARKRQQKLYSWSQERRKKKHKQHSPIRAWQYTPKSFKNGRNGNMNHRKRRFSDMNSNGSNNRNHNGSPKKKQKTMEEYYGDDDLDELISINSQIMDDHFPSIVANENRMRSKDTQSIMIANQQTDELMNTILPTLTKDVDSGRSAQKTMNGESLFGFDLPDFKELASTNSNDSGNNHNKNKHKNHNHHHSHNHNVNDKHPDNHCHAHSKKRTQAIMDIIQGEVKLSNILAEWQSKFEKEEDQLIPILDMGSDDIPISNHDLSNLELFGIGQINKKWIVTRLRQYILIIDQHAADERIKLENCTNFLMDSKNGPNRFRIKQKVCEMNGCQMFIDNVDLLTLNRHSKWIKDWGFHYEIIDDDINNNNNNNNTTSMIKVYKTPEIYGTSVVAGELREILSNIASMTDERVKKYVPKCIQRVLASKACKNAIKFGDKLNDKQMKNLLKKLSVCKLPFQCAHGRPTLFPIANLTQFVCN